LLKVEAGGTKGRVTFLSKDNRLIQANLDEPMTNGQSQELALLDFKIVKSPQNLIFVKISADDKLLTIEQVNNNLTVEDLHTGKTVVRYNGITEEPYGFEQYRSFRYAKEDLYPLWRKGKGSMVLLNP